MNYDPFTSIKSADGQPNVLLSILRYLTDSQQDEIVKAIHAIPNRELQETLIALGEQYFTAIAQDYTDMNEYFRDQAMCQRFEDDELDRCWYIHHDPHAEMMADLPF
jgi:hypothetical protein